ncbi:MAG: sulfatase-like hydrolase/transferase [Opitutales bacterium]|nr:sulfatase-like hydrolase/transferase [Opitutales bacterium]
MKFYTGCLFLFALQFLWAQDEQPPNIVFIIADDLGWGDVGFHGGNAPTPHLDRLAKESIELTEHYVAPVCSRTRVGLLTGRYWSRFGVTTPTNTRALPYDTVTLAKALKSKGYDTALIGKWHLGSKSEWGPNHFGFDHSYGSLAGGVTSWSHRYKVGPFTHTWHRNEELIEEEGHVTDLLTNEALEWIAGRSEKPFFLYMPYTAIHLPINEPQEWLDKVPESISSEIARQYAACVMHLDDSVGRILAALEEHGIRENTLFVFTSDNGGSTTTNNTQPYPPDDSPPGHLTASNAPFRGQKGSVYEGGTRVPTLISWPDKFTPRKESTPAVIIDWMPTFCQLVGYSSVKDLKWDGVDLSGLLLKQKSIPDRSIYIPGPHWRAISLRKGDWKVVVSGEGEEQSKELFNLVKDPLEKLDLADRELARLIDMVSELEDFRLRDNDSVVN